MAASNTFYPEPIWPQLKYPKDWERPSISCLIAKKEIIFMTVQNLGSPDVDNDVLVDAREHYIKISDFVDVNIYEAGDFDLYGKPV